MSGGLASQTNLSKQPLKIFESEELMEGIAETQLASESDAKTDFPRCGVAAFGK